MWQVIAGVVQILFLVLKNKFEKDAAKKEEKRELYEEAKDAIKSGDASRIVGVADRLRQ